MDNSNNQSNQAEWEWLFNHAIDWENILKIHYPKYPTAHGFIDKKEVLSFFCELLEETRLWSEKVNKLYVTDLDRNGIGTVRDGRTILGETIKKIYKEAAEIGLFGIPIAQEYGGMGLPVILNLIFMAQISKACVGVSTQLSFFTGIADMLDRYANADDKKRLIPQIVAGKISGSMNLTESDCGSDLSLIKTNAIIRDDGTYLINGSKCFITNGGGGLGLVLAKIKGAPQNLKGLSMFLVEQDLAGKKAPNYLVTKNEEKMGMHSSFTTEVVYQNSIGKLIGEENHGFKIMLHLMNEARLTTAIQALGLIEASTEYARQYAKVRKAFGKAIEKLPLLKRNLEEMEIERNALRAFLVDSMSWFELYTSLDFKKNKTDDLSKDEQKLYAESKIWLRKRTPLCKYYATEKATELTKKCIQILGGYGYMKDYPVERYHRDSFGPLLYEGTSQIQALMALKDVFKYAVSEPKLFFSNIVGKISTTKYLPGHPEWEKEYKNTHFKFKRKMISLFIKTLKPSKTKQLINVKHWLKEEGLEKMMIHAETLCEGLSYMEVLRVLNSHCYKNESRSRLFFQYHKLILPRLEAIYMDWSLH